MNKLLTLFVVALLAVTATPTLAQSGVLITDEKVDDVTEEKPDPDALLELRSDTRGLLLPTLSTEFRRELLSGDRKAAPGLFFFDPVDNLIAVVGKDSLLMRPREVASLLIEKLSVPKKITLPLSIQLGGPLIGERFLFMAPLAIPEGSKITRVTIHYTTDRNIPEGYLEVENLVRGTSSTVAKTFLPFRDENGGPVFSNDLNLEGVAEVESTAPNTAYTVVVRAFPGSVNGVTVVYREQLDGKDE